MAFGACRPGRLAEGATAALEPVAEGDEGADAAELAEGIGEGAVEGDADAVAVDLEGWAPDQRGSRGREVAGGPALRAFQVRW